MIRRPPRSTQSRSSAASDVYKRQHQLRARLYLHSNRLSHMQALHQSVFVLTMPRNLSRQSSLIFVLVIRSPFSENGAIHINSIKMESSSIWYTFLPRRRVFFFYRAALDRRFGPSLSFMPSMCTTIFLIARYREMWPPSCGLSVDPFSSTYVLLVVIVPS